MSGNTNKIPLIIAVIEQRRKEYAQSLDYAITGKDWAMALSTQTKIEAIEEILGVVKTIGVKTETILAEMQGKERRRDE